MKSSTTTLLRRLGSISAQQVLELSLHILQCICVTVGGEFLARFCDFLQYLLYLCNVYNQRISKSGGDGEGAYHQAPHLSEFRPHRQ